MQAVRKSLIALPPLVVFGLLGAAAMLIPAGYASATDAPHLARIFIQAALISGVVLVLLALAMAARPHPATARGMLLTMLGTYAILPIMLALPLAMALPDTGLFNAWWEMVSSLTTTGASLYAADRLADPLHLWRGLVGWLGGLHMLVAAIAIMAPLHIGGFEIMTTPYDRLDAFDRVPGGIGQQITQPHTASEADTSRLDLPMRRLQRAVMAVIPVYAGLTLVLWLLLLIAGDPGLVALMRALGTISTSGIAPVARPVGTASGFWGEAMVLIFLIPALSRRFWPGGGELIATERLRDDPELRMAAGLAAMVALILLLRHFIAEAELTAPMPVADQAPRGAFAAAWGGFFTALSFLTTTGWTSLDWAHARFWSGLTSPGLMLAGLAMMGGGVATAAGGVKLLRVYALARQSARELERIFHPSSVAGGGRAARRLRREGAYLAFIAFALFAVSIAVVVMLVSIQKVSFDSATILSVAALSNTGQLTASIPLMPVFEGSAGLAGAPWEGWAGLPDFTKLVLAGAMIVGRIETLAILALFSPDLWRR